MATTHGRFIRRRSIGKRRFGRTPLQKSGQRRFLSGARVLAAVLWRDERLFSLMYTSVLPGCRLRFRRDRTQNEAGNAVRASWPYGPERRRLLVGNTREHCQGSAERRARGR